MSIKEDREIALPMVDPPESGQLIMQQILERLVLDLGWTPVARDKYGDLLYEQITITGGKP